LTCRGHPQLLEIAHEKAKSANRYDTRNTVQSKHEGSFYKDQFDGFS
jgi:hypothetical protein